MEIALAIVVLILVMAAAQTREQKAESQAWIKRVERPLLIATAATLAILFFPYHWF